jgi:hypothetical protein
MVLSALRNERKEFMNTFIQLILLGVASAAFSQEPSAREILAPFTAHWKGVFKVYSYDGRLLNQIEVEQRYWWQGEEQHAEFIEKDRSGRLVKAKARNYAQNGKLYCAVEKDNGEKSLHHGHFEDGALFWFRKTEDQATIESFKERVLPGARGKEYHIDGIGIYGSGAKASCLLFEGRYYESKP